MNKFWLVVRIYGKGRNERAEVYDLVHESEQKAKNSAKNHAEGTPGTTFTVAEITYAVGSRAVVDEIPLQNPNNIPELPNEDEDDDEDDGAFVLNLDPFNGA